MVAAVPTHVLAQDVADLAFDTLAILALVKVMCPDPTFTRALLGADTCI
jgi:hypothetical protein